MTLESNKLTTKARTNPDKATNKQTTNNETETETDLLYILTFFKYKNKKYFSFKDTIQIHASYPTVTLRKTVKKDTYL